MTEEISIKNRSELIPLLEGLVGSEIRERGLDAQIFIIVGSGSEARQVRRQLSKVLGCMIGVKIGSPSLIFEGLTKERFIHSSIRELLMLRALQEKEPDLIEESDPLSYASSFIQKFETLKKHLIEIDEGEDQDLLMDYLEKVHDEGYQDNLEILESMELPECNLLIILENDMYTPFDKKKMDDWDPLKRVKIKIEEDLTGPGERVIEEKKIEPIDAPSHVKYTRFSKRSDEIEAIAKEVRSVIGKGIDADEIAICIPDGSVEELVSSLEKVDVPANYHFTVPINGLPTTDTVINLINLLFKPNDPRAIVKLIKDPLVNDKCKGGLQSLFPILERLIKIWFIEEPSDWKRAIESEKRSIENLSEDEEPEQNIVETIEKLEQWIAKGKTVPFYFPAKGSLSEMSQILIWAINWSKLLEGIRSLPEDIILKNSRSYNTIERSCLELFKDGNDIGVTKEEFKQIMMELISRSTMPITSRERRGVKIHSHSDIGMLEPKVLFLGGCSSGELPGRAGQIILASNENRAKIRDSKEEGLKKKVKKELIRLFNSCDRMYISHDLESSPDPSDAVLHFISSFKDIESWTSPHNIYSLQEVQGNFKALFDGKDLKDVEWVDIDRINAKGQALFSRENDPQSENNLLIKDDGLDIIREKFGEDHKWSSSRFEKYIKCPFKFLTEEILTIEEPQETALEPDRMTRGSIIHDILFEHCERVRTNAIGMNDKDLLEDIELEEDHL
jgi:ATP-dependent helicase/DNAse subunit B